MSLSGGECRQFPARWTGRMWGGEETGDQRERAELARAAVRICEACPVRAECLAFAIVMRDQNGIYGGLPLRARRNVRRIAERAGLVLDGVEPATAQRRLTGFIRANPEVVKAAREHERERQRTDNESARRKRWRSTHPRERSTSTTRIPRFDTHASEPNVQQGTLPFDMH